MRFLTNRELNRIINRSRSGETFGHWAAVIVRNVRYFEWDVKDVKLALAIIAGSDWARKAAAK